jgi:hypothetical protein
MNKTVVAIFDGQAFYPEEPIDLKPQTRVRITVDAVSGATEANGSFLETAQSLDLDGPKDWAENLDKYLYGSEKSE